MCSCQNRVRVNEQRLSKCQSFQLKSNENRSSFPFPDRPIRMPLHLQTVVVLILQGKPETHLLEWFAGRERAGGGSHATLFIQEELRDKEREEVSMKGHEEGGEMEGVKAKARQIEYKKKILKEDLNPFVSLTQEWARGLRWLVYRTVS